MLERIAEELMPKQVTTLRDFINQELRQRQMSATKFAEFVGVVPSTITRAIDETKEPPMPSLEFLAKLAAATKVDICTLVALVIPNANTGEDANARLLTARIQRLGPNEQEVLESFIVNAALKGDE